MLLICSSSCVLYFTGSGVKSACCFVWVENELVYLNSCMYFVGMLGCLLLLC